jgi:hypothetical protein
MAFSGANQAALGEDQLHTRSLTISPRFMFIVPPGTAANGQPCGNQESSTPKNEAIRPRLSWIPAFAGMTACWVCRRAKPLCRKFWGVPQEVQDTSCRESEGVPQLFFLSPKNGGSRGLKGKHETRLASQREDTTIQ